LVDDQGYAHGLGESGRMLLDSGYNWDNRFQTLLASVEQAIETRRGGRMAASA
jgi:hypothetical protein